MSETIEPQTMVKFSWELPSSSAEEVQQRLDELQKAGNDVAIEQDDRIAFIAVIGGAIAVIVLANMVIDLYRRVTRHGVLIDASDPTNIRVKEDPNLEFGIIVAVDRKGETKQYDQRKTPVGVEAILKTLTG